MRSIIKIYNLLACVNDNKKIPKRTGQSQSQKTTYIFELYGVNI